MQRTAFHEKNLIYMLSLDLDLGYGRRGGGSGQRVVPQERVLTSMAHDFTSQEELPDEVSHSVYNALGDERVMGYPAPVGTVDFAQDTIRYLPCQDYAEIVGRLVFRAGGDLIEAEYQGVARPKPFMAIRSGYGIDGELSPVHAKAHIRTRFETGSAKYRWLVQQQCVGYGTLTLTRGEPEFATFDVYAVT
ncbi:MAG: DUF3237 family protein [Myxococcales bacterium]|nr:DUF3237 family protein [Myxococcales bacterium]MDD9971625.1 DUF3237 family protein [Myxococcales bacterium]